MLSMKNCGRLAVAGACLFALTVMSLNDAAARPKYASVMTKQYEDLAKKHGKNGKLTCAVCHPSKSKKDRNNFGAAMTKALGEKNVKDEDKIKEALVKLEKEKSATEGKTFGDLIKDGKLPGTDDVAEGPGKEEK